MQVTLTYSFPVSHTPPTSGYLVRKDAYVQVSHLIAAKYYPGLSVWEELNWSEALLKRTHGGSWYDLDMMLNLCLCA